MPIVEYEIILPDTPIIDLPKLKRQLLRTLQEEARAAHGLYELFYGTWHGEKPTMPEKAKVTDEEAYAECVTQGDNLGNRKLMWLDDGTAIRYSAVSKDFVPKTAKRQIRSGRGRGTVRPSRTPHRGIDAREISDTIAEARKPHFERNIQKDFDSL